MSVQADSLWELLGESGRGDFGDFDLGDFGDLVLVGLFGLRGGEPCADKPEHDLRLEGGLFTGRHASYGFEAVVDIPPVC